MRQRLSVLLAALALCASSQAQTQIQPSGGAGGGTHSSTAGGGVLISDDFNACAGIESFWTPQDPQGDAVFSLTGVGSGDAYLEIAVPGGSEHQSFNGLAAPYLAQSVANTDFEVEIAIESLPTDGQLLGLMVLQDANRWIRFDLYGLGSSVFLYSGVTKNGNTSNRANVGIPVSTGPARMRVSRVGSGWSCDIATGSGAFQTLASFNFNLSVGEVGPYAGNFGSNPPHVARFDYAFDTSAPVVAEDGDTGSGVSSISVQLDGPGQVTLNPPGGSYTCGTLVTLTAIPDAGFEFDGWSGALSGTSSVETLVAAGDLQVTAAFDDGIVDPPEDPVISGLSSTPAARSAVISWTTDIPSDSRVDFGATSAYGQSVSSSALVTSHSLVVDGLDPEGTYHFAVESTTPEGGAAASGDALFTTLAEVGLASDDFNTCAGGLSAFWTLEDPQGDSMVALTGVGSDDALLNIAVAGGSPHRAWGTLQAPFLGQSVPDENFSLRTRLEFAPGNNQTAGILVYQDADDWIRFDLSGNNGQLQAYAAVTSGGSTGGKTNKTIAGGEPIWMQLTRTGNKYIWSVSYDGTNFTTLKAFRKTMPVARVGLYAGNSGASPAYTAQFDYFENTSSPLTTEDGPISGGGNPSTLTVTTVGGGTVTRTPDQATYSCGETVTLTAVPNAGQQFDSWSGDLAGSSNPITVVVDQDRAISATFVPDAGGGDEPPVLSNVQIQAGATQAQVTWDTDLASDSRAMWGAGDLSNTTSDAALVFQHNLLIQGLSPQTTYDLSLQSTSGVGLAGEATGLVFTTGPGGGFESDDFQSCAGLGSQWTFVDSIFGDCSADLVGVGSAEAVLRIDVPAGTEHQAFQSITAPYVVQDVPDADLELEAKFLTRPQAAYAIQGILALGDAGRWIRFDTYGSGSTTRWYVGRTQNGNTTQVAEGPLPAVGAPLWMRIARDGDTWTYRYSVDGASFTDLVSFNFSMDLERIGPYAGNASGSASPAFTSEVDYVFATSSPIVPEDGPSSGSYTVSASVPGGGGSVSIDPDQASYACGDVVTVTAIPASGKEFDSWSGAASGSQNPLSFVVGGDSNLVATFVDVSTGPVISGIAITPMQDGAVVSWSTDVPATSRVDYGLTTAYGFVQEETSLVQSHTLTLSGLAAGTLYNLQLTSVSATSAGTSSDNQTFTTVPPPSLASDDFNGTNLDRGLWQFTDPGGLAELRMTGSGTQDARLELQVPAGVPYVPYGTNGGARISQPAPNTDFTATVRFESEISAINCSTGIFAEADEDNWVRFDFFYDGQDLNLFSSSFTNGNAGDLRNTVVQSGPWPAGSPIYLRLARTGLIWTADYSFDGTNFQTGNFFHQSLAMQRVGIFAGNDGANPLAHTVAVDWFFDAGDPIVPEDPAPGADGTNPWIYNATAVVLGPNAAELRWWTDEPTTGDVAWGLDQTYASGSIASVGLAYEHSVLVTGLAAGSTYHFRASADDLAGNTGSSPDFTFVTPGPPGPGEPFVDFWYGENDPITGTNVQRFGFLGDAQAQVNIVGRVDDTDEDRVALTVNLQYRLNGGPLQDATLGDDRNINYAPWRLANEGDFNIELYPAELSQIQPTNGVHRNVLELVASDDDGNVTIRPCYVDYTSGVDWEPNPSISWADVLNNQNGDLREVAQVVDGNWRVEDLPGLGPVLRTDPAHQGYDRIVALGEAAGAGAWVDYEALVPITVLALDPQGFTTGTGSHAMGLIMRWGGHTVDGPYPQPFHGIYPLGSIWIYRWYPSSDRWELWINENEQILPQQGNDISIGTTYLYRVRVESLPGGFTFHAFKLWEEGSTEPSGWTFTQTTNPGDPPSGSLAVFAHHADIAVGDIQVTQLP